MRKGSRATCMFSGGNCSSSTAGLLSRVSWCPGTQQAARAPLQAHCDELLGTDGFEGQRFGPLTVEVSVGSSSASSSLGCCPPGHTWTDLHSMLGAGLAGFPGDRHQRGNPEAGGVSHVRQDFHLGPGHLRCWPRLGPVFRMLPKQPSFRP